LGDEGKFKANQDKVSALISKLKWNKKKSWGYSLSWIEVA
jgi:hypothetical protein